MFTFPFFFRSIMLGMGLAMDAFSVSLANGLSEPKMTKKKTVGIAGVFAFFQFLMPLVGWICVHTILVYFQAFKKAIPWIALVLLAFIGVKMIVDGLRGGEDSEKPKVGVCALILQGIATSIDALSVGFTIVEYSFLLAVCSSSIIAIVTLGLCLLGLSIGKKFGTKLSGKASIFGGAVLVVIGVEIFLSAIL